MAPHSKLCAFILILGACSVSLASNNALPEDMHRDMYCIGCEMTMKVVVKSLTRAPKDQLDVLVPQTLRRICKPNHFDISEFSKDSLSDACKHLISEHRTSLEAALVGHYRRENPPSYLDLVQKVCLDLTDACHGVTHDDHDHDPLKDDARVKFDRDSNDFIVLPGKNMKVAKPVLQSTHEEL
ncbi:uncharacterized protein [Littorina saxatilis]|uniref:Saposin B-type domain-containing protein n=1 Tax=Littorina saxatilis TaxID=31220 RepID=A0AAN9BVE6_9CAEN